jgi:hypothetical protein
VSIFDGHTFEGPKAARFSRSLAVRIGLAFLLGFVLLQLIVAAAMMWPDEHPAVLRLVAADEAASIAQALEAVPAAAQPLVVQALTSSRIAAHLQAMFEQGASEAHEGPGRDRARPVHLPYAAAAARGFHR